MSNNNTGVSEMEEKKQETMYPESQVKEFESRANTLLAERNQRIQTMDKRIQVRNAIILWCGLTWVSILTLRIMAVL